MSLTYPYAENAIKLEQKKFRYDSCKAYVKIGFLFRLETKYRGCWVCWRLIKRFNKIPCLYCGDYTYGLV